MRRIRSVYLSGPAVHLETAQAVLLQCRRLCEAAGYQALTQTPDQLMEREPSEAMAREIYAERASRMRQADAGVIDFTPFRGPHCDPSAAFEAGFLAGLGKPVFGYLNVPSEDEAELCARVAVYVGAEPDEEGVWRDLQGSTVEDFGLPESLMIWAEARRFFVIVTPDPTGDLTGLELCLEAVGMYLD
jgi:nucleoside 2-deoxyribosyltransferase